MCPAALVKRRRWTAALLCATFALAAGPARAAHTTPSAAPGPRAPGARQELVVVAAYPPLDEVVRNALPQWRKLHPEVEVHVLSRAYDNHHSAMMASLTTASNLPDVIVTAIDHLGRIAYTNELEDLARGGYDLRALRPLLVPFAARQGMTASGAMVAIPLDIGPATLLFREDILRRAGVSVGELTASWQSFLEAGVRIKASTGAALISHAVYLAETIIQAGARPGQGLYFGPDDQPLVQSARFVHGFELALAARRMGVDAATGDWSPSWSEKLRAGGLATLLTGPWMVGHLSNWLAPQAQGLWRAAQLPAASWSFNGGAFMEIPRRSRNKALAWEFVRFMALNRAVQVQSFKTHVALPVLLEAQDDPAFTQPIAYLGGQVAGTLWREASRRAAGTQPHDLDDAARYVVAQELDKVLTQGKGIERALRDAQETLERLARERRRAQ